MINQRSVSGRIARLIAQLIGYQNFHLRRVQFPCPQFVSIKTYNQPSAVAVDHFFFFFFNKSRNLKKKTNIEHFFNWFNRAKTNYYV